MTRAVRVLAALLLCCSAGRAQVPQLTETLAVPSLGITLRAPRETVGLPELLVDFEQSSVHARFKISGSTLVVHGFPLAEAQRRPQQARDWREWVTEMDPTIRDRKYLQKGARVEPTGRGTAHALWEFSDSSELGPPIRRIAAQYDFADRTVVIVQRVRMKRDEVNSEWAKMVHAIFASVEQVADLPPGDVDVRPPEPALTASWAPLWSQAERSLRHMPTWSLRRVGQSLVLASNDTPYSKRAREDDQDIAASAAMFEATRQLVVSLLPLLEDQEQPFLLRICGRDSVSDFVGPQRIFSPTRYSHRARELVTSDQAETAKVREHGAKAGILEQQLHRHLGDREDGSANLPRPWLLSGYHAFLATATRTVGRDWKIAHDRGRYRELRKALGDDLETPLQQLLLTSDPAFSTTNRDLAYALIEFLHGDGRKPRGWQPEWKQIPERYLRTLRETKDPAKAHAAAFDDVDLRTFSQALAAWAKHRAQ